MQIHCMIRHILLVNQKKYMNRTCDKCSAKIPHGNPYICVTHNIVYMETDLATRSDIVNSIDSDEILVLCGQCGNRINKEAMSQMLKAIPISQKMVISN